MSNKIYTSQVLEILENGDALVEIPEELLTEIGWLVGDKLDYEVKDGAVYIKNIDFEDRKKQSNSI
jgi:hypothetical protein